MLDKEMYLLLFLMKLILKFINFKFVHWNAGAGQGVKYVKEENNYLNKWCENLLCF